MPNHQLHHRQRKNQNQTSPSLEMTVHLQNFNTLEDVQLTQSYVINPSQNPVNTKLCKRRKIFLIGLLLSFLAIMFIFFFDAFALIYQKGFNPNAEIYDLIELNSTSALCLDGTPASYLISRTGDPSKILIFFPPGAWCAEATDQTTLQSCYLRSKTSRGSSKSLPKESIMSFGILANHPTNYFKDWKRVYFHYCDGTGYQGTRKDPILYKNEFLYFRGHNITVERFQDVQQRLGLFSRAQNVVISGESAGGLATLMWTNYLAQKVQKGKVWSIVDASIFSNSDIQNTRNQSLLNKFKNMLKLTSTRINLPATQCLNQFPIQKQQCMFAQNLIKHIKTPLFLTQSLYDSYTLKNVLELNCVNNNSIKNCNKSEMQVIEKNRVNVLGILKQAGKDKKNGVWGISCVKHQTFSRPDYTDQRFSIPQNSLMTASQAISGWMSGKTQQNVHLDLNLWSDNIPCS